MSGLQHPLRLKLGSFSYCSWARQGSAELPCGRKIRQDAGRYVVVHAKEGEPELGSGTF